MKKFLSFLLAVLMIVTILPAAAFAADDISAALLGGTLTTYPVTLNGITVTEENKADVLGDLDVGASVVYTPAEDGNDAVLTFYDDCTVSGINCSENLTITAANKPVVVTLTGPMLLGSVGQNKTVTIKGGNETLTIRPKLTGGVNAFRPIAIRSGNTLILKNGAILTGSRFVCNTDQNAGGGMINVAENATFVLNGGTIEDCATSSATYDSLFSHAGRGGAIYVNAGGTFSMCGGTIRDCMATVAGGAVFSRGTVNMSGGTITECTVSGMDEDGTVKAKGGAIYLLDGSMTMVGGTISGNKLANVADMRGAGVYAGSGVSLTLGGTAKITANKDKGGSGKVSNLYLYDGVRVNVGVEGLAPASGMKIGVTAKQAAPVAISNSCVNCAKYFVADNADQTVLYQDGALTLGIKSNDFESSYVAAMTATVNSVVVNSAKNGTVSVNQKTAISGEKVTITAKPNKGFTVEEVTVLDKNGKQLSVKNLGGNKFSFEMPKSKATVKVTFAEDNTMLNFCVDVHVSDYYYDAVLWAYQNTICSGTDAVHFAPNAPITRGQIVTFLWRASGCPAAEHTAARFKDVDPDAYYVKAVEWALSQGITVGTSETTFSPDAVCTRGQIVTFLARCAGIKDADTQSVFTDVNANDFFAAAVKWAKDTGITGGTSATTFSPNDDCTRAQGVAFLYRWKVR